MKLNKNIKPIRHILGITSFFLLIVGSYSQIFDRNFVQLPGFKVSDNLNVKILEINSFYGWLWSNLWVGIFHLAQYFALGYLFELTNPAPKTDYRKKMTKKQMVMGFWALVWVIVATTLIMWKVEDLLPYAGYYDTHDLNLKNTILQIAVYLFSFDTWFWMTHMMVHHPFLMKHMHQQHHEFIEPAAYGQDAVHPIESLIQGPLGHYLGSFFYPIHPVIHVILGLLTSIWALAAHDGRFDPNGHIMHHWYGDCNYGLYWGFWDYIFNTRYSKKKYPIEYIPTWKRENKKSPLEKNKKIA